MVKIEFKLIFMISVVSVIFLSGCDTSENFYGEAVKKSSRDSSVRKIILPAQDLSKCYDNDGGIKEGDLGAAILGGSKSEDYCKNSQELVEFYCRNNLVASQTIACAKGCAKGACLSAATYCEKIFGKDDLPGIKIIFAPDKFTSAEIMGIVKAEINQILFGEDASPLQSQQTGFLEVGIIQKNLDKIKVYLITEEIGNSCKTGECTVKEVQDFVVEKCPFFNLGKDMIVQFKNEDTGMAYAIYSEDLNNKYIMASPGMGMSFTHEFGHAFAGLNEEYFFSGILFSEDKLYSLGEKQSGWGSANCDLHQTPCLIWCGGTNESAYKIYSEKLKLFEDCGAILEKGDETAWLELCPQLGFEGEQKKWCENLDWYENSIYKKGVCSLNTLDKIKYLNLGNNCQDGTGCYFGCGAAMNAFRSSLYSIMGCGDADDCDDIYGYAKEGQVIIEPLFPLAIPGFNLISEKEIQKQFDLIK